MKKVLIALDYHPVSEKVAEAGYELAKKLDAEVCLIHVIADASYYEISYPEFMGYVPVSDAAKRGETLNDMQRTGEEFLAKSKTHLNDPSVKTHLAEGKTKDAILNYSKEWNTDILVMGTHGHNVFEKMIMGTVASSVIERSEIPVYLVPVKK